MEGVSVCYDGRTCTEDSHSSKLFSTQINHQISSNHFSNKISTKQVINADFSTLKIFDQSDSNWSKGLGAKGVFEK